MILDLMRTNFKESEGIAIVSSFSTTDRNR